MQRTRDTIVLLRWLLAASVVLPILLFALAAWENQKSLLRDAERTVQTTVGTLHEHAVKVFETQELALSLIDDHLRGLSWGEIGRSEEVHRFLARIAAHYDQIDAIWLVDGKGVTRASSHLFPMPHSDVTNRDYFQALESGDPGVYVGQYFYGRYLGHPQFSVSKRRSTPDGRFDGLIMLSIHPGYFVDFYNTVTRADDSHKVGLVRADGRVLVRDPPFPAGTEPAAMKAQPAVMGLVSGRSEGVVTVYADADHQTRIIGFKKLAHYPIYVLYGISEGSVLARWRHTVLVYGMFAFPAMAALVVMAWFALRRTREQAAAATALQESEQRYRALYTTAPAAMHALDAERRILDVNNRWLELFGYAREEAVGRPITDFHAPSGGGERHALRWSELMATGRLREVERKYLAKSGMVIETLVSATLERDAQGAFRRSLTVVTDVTARKRAEAAARRERQLSELLIDSGTEGIVGYDRAFRFTVWNPAMEAISGIRRDALVGRGIFDASPHIIGTPVEAALRATIEGRRTSLRDYPYNFARSGRTGFCHADFAPLYGADGTIIGGLMFVRDMTDSHRMEAELRQAQKMEAVGQLTGGVAHDFNNLLTIIAASLDLLVPEIRSARGKQLVEAAQRGAERGARLTHALLAFARRQTLRPEIVDPNQLVKEFRELLRRAAGETVELQLLLSPTVHPCRLDPAQFQSALLNLVVNARDAMPAGGKIAIETQNHLAAGSHRSEADEIAPGDYVLVAVSDTGTGMPPEVLAKAFEPFFTTKEVGQGSGLGLSQVYGFVRQSGGYVQLASDLGAGTTVRLYLPRSTDGGAAEAAARPAIPRAVGTETILVVEDDSDVRVTVSESLRILGYRVLTTSDGPAALALLEAGEAVDLLFTDMVMPNGLRGDELARRASALRPALKVLLTSGYAAAQDGGAPDAYPILRKPHRHDDLARAIHEALGR